MSKEVAEIIDKEVWEALPRRLLPILGLILVLLSLSACGTLIKPDDPYLMYGPRQTFDSIERNQGKE